MLNVTIQNDGKIKIQSECSNTKEMRHNVNLLLAVVSSMEMEEKVNKEEGANKEEEANKDVDDDTAQTNHLLHLVKVEDCNRLSTIRTLSQQLNISLKEAKVIIDAASDDKHSTLLVQSVDLNFINNVRNALESVGCICKITNGF